MYPNYSLSDNSTFTVVICNDVNVVNNRGYTPLMEASKRGHSKIVNLLVNNGNIDDINVTNNEG